MQPDGRGVEEMVADKGYHSDETLVALGEVGVRSHVSETGARPAPLAGQEDGRDAAGEASCAEGLVCEPPACARAAGSPPATPPGRDSGAYFRAHV